MKSTKNRKGLRFKFHGIEPYKAREIIDKNNIILVSMGGGNRRLPHIMMEIHP